MGDYDRATRACTLATMTPALAAALRAHAAQYQLNDLDAPGVRCWETTSTKKKKGLFGGKPEVVLTGIVLAPPILLWAAGKAGEKPAVLSGRLRDLQAQDYEQSSMYKLVADSGLHTGVVEKPFHPETIAGALRAVQHFKETGEVPNWAPRELMIVGNH